MTTPPLAALQAADQLAQQAHAALCPGTVTIGATPYAGAVIIHEEGWELTEQGLRLIQRLEAWIAKSLLATPPALGSTLLVGGLGFKLIKIGPEGWSAPDTNWQLLASRQPGQDA